MQYVILAALLVLWAVTRKTVIDSNNQFGKVIRPVYKMSIGLYQLCQKSRRITAYYKKLGDKLHILYPALDRNNMIKQFVCYKVMWILIFILIGTVVSFGFIIPDRRGEAVVQTVKRDGYWGEERTEELQVSVDGVIDKELFQFRVKEQQYPEDQILVLLKKKSGQLEKLVLKKNSSIDYVTSDLNLVRKIPNTDIEVIWEIENDEIIQFDGTVQIEKLNQEGELVQLTATLSYEGKSYTHSFYVHVFPQKMSDKDSYKNKLISEIERKDAQTDTQDFLELPTKIDGKKVEFIKASDKYSEKILIAAFLFSIHIFYFQDKKINKQMVFRKSQLLSDYPELVSKVTLLLGAGMTIRGTIEKIAEDYLVSRHKNGYRKQYVYDELAITWREIQGGVSEKSAIDYWGRRCQLQCYIKLSTVLQQNLKKGSEGLAAVLSYEVSDAFQKRKNAAKKMGEEAGTKLLIPMSFMLLIVLIILIMPACMSFRI